VEPVTDLCSLSLRYVIGELGEFDKKRFERHLSECLQCQQDCTEYRELLKWLQSSSEGAPPRRTSVVIPLFPEASTDHPVFRPRWYRRPARWLWRLRAVPLAATMLFTVLMVPHLFHHVGLRLHNDLRHSAVRLRRVETSANLKLRHLDADAFADALTLWRDALSRADIV
jgi:hypothetical protein